MNQGEPLVIYTEKIRVIPNERQNPISLEIEALLGTDGGEQLRGGIQGDTNSS